MMKTSVLAVLLFSLFTSAFAAAPLLFYVATNGNDQWSGHRDSPNASNGDGPFATLSRAVDSVRQARRIPTNWPAIIFIRGGVYYLKEPLELKPEDSEVTFAAYRNETPVLSGGRRITGWKPVTVDGKNLWAANVPEARGGNWFFRELWVNGRRAVRARHPNHGYFSVAGLPEETKEWTQGQSRFTFKDGDLKDWKTITNAEILVMNRWVESRLPVASVDEAQHLVTFTKHSVFQLATNDLYWLEGAFEALDEPGEWYLDPIAGTLYYLPRSGENLEHIEAVAPAMSQVVRFTGNPEAGQFIKRIQFRGLTFAHTEWCFPAGFESGKAKPEIWPPPKADVGGFGQAAVGVPGAIHGDGVRDCVWEACTFEHLGDYGLELARGCCGNWIVRCNFSDLGAGGIKLGETAIRHDAADQSRSNNVSHCEIRDGGKMFPSGIGIWIGQSPDNSLTHNLIHDFYYTGISIGWTWGYGPAAATNNYVAFNHVHHIGIKADGDGPILSDMGGIYTLGQQPGTRILNNLWHDIAGLRYGGWGIYFDEGSSSIVARSNVVYRTTHGGFHQHYGATNFVQNNIFAFGRDQQLQRTRPEPHLSFSFTTNIVYFDSGVLLGGNWSNDKYVMDRNIYWDSRLKPGSTEMSFAGATFDQWRVRDHDVHSIIADPLFVAPQKYDFRLQPGSPARKLDFQPIDLRPVPK
jgi:hypothetical protein